MVILMQHDNGKHTHHYVLFILVDTVTCNIDVYILESIHLVYRVCWNEQKKFDTLTLLKVISPHLYVHLVRYCWDISYAHCSTTQ